jgi:DNA polymerase-3 subunit beta
LKGNTMKLTVDRAAFLRSFERVAPIASGKTKEVLGYVLLRVQGDSVELQATDGETCIIEAIKPEAISEQRDGSALLSPSKVIAILKESKGDDVTIETNNNAIEITTDSGAFKLASINPDEFPRSNHKQQPGAILSGAELQAALARTSYACDVESTRYQLGGVLLQASQGDASFVATDGRRLALHSCEVIGAAIEKAIIPARCCAMLMRLFRDADSVELSTDGKSISATSGATKLTSALIEGRFPAWEKVLPDGPFTFAATAHVGSLLSCVRQACVTSDETTHAIDLHFADGNLFIKSQAADVGSSAVSMPIDGNFEPLTITLDHRYLTQLLRSLPADDFVQIEGKTSKDPVLVTLGKTQAVLMPMNKA